jgi:hypothetical protein
MDGGMEHLFYVPWPLGHCFLKYSNLQCPKLSQWSSTKLLLLLVQWLGKNPRPRLVRPIWRRPNHCRVSFCFYLVIIVQSLTN